MNFYIEVPIRIYPITPFDLEAVLVIENRSFSDPFTRQMFESLLGQESYGGLVAQKDSEVVGYVIWSLVADEMEIITIAVDTPWRRQWIANTLMRETVKTAQENKVISIFLYVRQSNVPALGLYEKFGFERIGVRKGYYNDNGEDAVVMRLEA